MPDPKKPQATQRPGQSATSDASAENDYDSRNSGRRAAGHGGGDMDRPGEFPNAQQEAGYEFSGGGRGHESNRSLARETDEDLESRSGPYTRAGQPAQSGSNAKDANPTDASSSGKSGSPRR